MCDPNYHQIRRTFALIFSKNYQCFEKLLSNTRKSVSSDIQTVRSWLKKTWLRLVFSTHFLVFGYLMKHPSLCLIYYFSNPLQ